MSSLHRPGPGRLAPEPQKPGPWINDGNGRGAAPLITLRGIRKQYGGADGAPVVEVLHGIDLDIQAGEFVAIVGQSGSGKSTLMNILGCLDRPSAGSYRLQGEDVGVLSADELARVRREAFGFIFQGYHLIPTESARENVEVPAVYAGAPEALRSERASHLLSRLGLAQRLDNRPHQLSGGQQQRVSIARALMNGGRVILADEPTGALDTRSGAEVMALFHELAQAGHTIILITHDREVAAQARRIVEMRDGRVISDQPNLTERASGAAPQAAVEGPSPSAAEATATTAAQPPPRPAVGPCARLARSVQADVGATLREVLRMAWRTMRMHRLRTALTLLGIIIGVASVVVMLGIGMGAREQVMARLGAMGATIMYLNNDFPPEGGPSGQVTMNELDEIARLAEVAHVMPVARDPALARAGNVTWRVDTIASTTAWPAVHHWLVAHGRFFTEQEDLQAAPVAVIGQQVARRFFGDEGQAGLQAGIGRSLLLGNAPFEVIGVMSAKGAESGSLDLDDVVIVPYRSGIYRVFTGGRSLDPHYTVVQARSSADILLAQAAIEALLLERHGRKDFYVANAAARLQAEMQTRNAMTLMLGLVAAVSLLVGGIGVMNVMLMSVKERTREIGIRMATGARQNDIMRQFLIEAIVITAAGGLAGALAGWLVGLALRAGEVPVAFSSLAVVLAVGCAVATGVLFGFMPARNAARLDPVQAMAAHS